MFKERIFKSVQAENCDSECVTVLKSGGMTEEQIAKVAGEGTAITGTCKTSSIIGDINDDKEVNAVDVQVVINAALGIGSVSV